MTELLRYFVVMAPAQLRAVVEGKFTMESWTKAWRAEEAAANDMNFDQVKAAIARQADLFAQLLAPCSDSDFRAEIEMFGSKASRGSWIVNLVLCHYAAYRMQLFLYLKASGREELNTMNLWGGADRPVGVAGLRQRQRRRQQHAKRGDNVADHRHGGLLV